VVYLLDVDGECWLDPDDEERMPNSWGSEYSVRYVGATPTGAKDAEGPGTPPGREDITKEEGICPGSRGRLNQQHHSLPRGESPGWAWGRDQAQV
jgi:hypothetical protein